MFDATNNLPDEALKEIPSCEVSGHRTQYWTELEDVDENNPCVRDMIPQKLNNDIGETPLARCLRRNRFLSL